MLRKKNDRCFKEHGFTLIELMIVVAIMGILISVAVPGYIKYVQKSRDVEAVHNLRKISQGASLYMTTHDGNAPTVHPLCPDTLCFSYAVSSNINAKTIFQTTLRYSGSQLDYIKKPSANNFDKVWSMIGFDPEDNLYFFYYYYVITTPDPNVLITNIYAERYLSVGTITRRVRYVVYGQKQDNHAIFTGPARTVYDN